MKVFAYLLLSGILSPPQWLTNMQEARQIALAKHRYILLNFSGSDWCGPCILLRKEVFDDPAFIRFADTALVLVNADFPRMKKNRLGKEQQQQNDGLADRYNPQGTFPLTVLMDAQGKVLTQWEGKPPGGPAEFTRQVRLAIDRMKEN